jgi:hypothetical protein
MFNRAFFFPTVEARWFQRGTIPAAVLAWFQQERAEPRPEPSRVDHYLMQTGGGSVGIKLREGRLEIKERAAQHGETQFSARAAGFVEAWDKWSFPLVSTLDDPQLAGSWIAVRKTRQVYTLQISEGAASPLVEFRFLAAGCNLELAQVEVRGETWWSLGLEAFGEASGNLARFIIVANYAFARGDSPQLETKFSYGYPAWLERLGLPKE